MSRVWIVEFEERRLWEVKVIADSKQDALNKAHDAVDESTWVEAWSFEAIPQNVAPPLRAVGDDDDPWRAA